MSLRLHAAEGESLLVNPTTGPDYNAAYTVLLAFRLETVPGDVFVIQMNAAATDNHDELIIFNPGGTIFFREVFSGVARDITWGSSVTRGVWYYVAMVRHSATSREWFIGTRPSNMVSVGIDSGGNVAARPAIGRFEIGTNDTAGGYLDGRIRYGQVFQAALSLAQIKAAYGPNRWARWNFANAADYLDSSGNVGRNLDPSFFSVNGMTTEADDTVTWPEADPLAGLSMNAVPSTQRAG